MISRVFELMQALLPVHARLCRGCRARKVWLVDGATSVLIVDDHAGFRLLARRLLESSGFVVRGEAGDGVTAVRAVRELRPDVVLLDIQLPDIDGFEVARRLADRGWRFLIVFVSARIAADYREQLATSEAAGFITKEELSGRALRSVLAGDGRLGRG